MKTFFMASLVFASTVGLLGYALFTPSIVAHVDGELDVPILLRIVDRDSGAPVTGCRVTIYDKEQEALRNAKEAARKAGVADHMPELQGVSGIADSDGAVHLNVRIPAALPYVMTHISRSRAEIYPSGFISVEFLGQARFEARLRELYFPSPCSIKRFSRVIMVRYPQKPNQSLEPMARSVTHPADAGCAPALAMAHH